VLTALSGIASAADPVPPPAGEEGWTFMAAPYLWASGIEGEIGLFGFPEQDVDIRFRDVLKNLGMGFMGVAEARNGPFSIGLDVVYAKLNTSIDTPRGILATAIDPEVETFMGTVVVGYSVVHGENVTVDLAAGVRLWSVDNDFEFVGGALNGVSVSDGDSWLDPVVGTKFQADIGSDFYLSGWAFVGGFGVSSDFMWDAMGGLGYRIDEHKSFFVGYRAVDVEFKNDGFVYDVTQMGPVLGGVIRF
jgi:hypothetical protein